MPPESSFDKFRQDHEHESFRSQVLKAQINVVELYYDRMLSESEAKSVTAALSKVTNQQEMELLKKEMEKWGIEDLQQLEYSDENDDAIAVLRSSFLEKSNELTASNWDVIFRTFIEEIQLRHPSAFQEMLVKGWLARLLEQSYECSRKENIGASRFGEAIVTIIKQVGEIPDFLYSNSRVIAGKRQPAFLESVEATLERLALVEHLPEAIGESVEGIIVGGSLSYGPFYNVRKNIDVTGGSDIDIICILPEKKGSGLFANLSQAGIFESADLDRFIRREENFQTLTENKTADVLSQRFHVTNKDFTVSAHFFPMETFLDMNDRSLATDLSLNEDKLYAIRDYKSNRFEHKNCIQQSFDGKEYVYEVPYQEEVIDGVITDLPGYIISDGRFFPGLYQNLLSPEFSVLFDKTGLTQKVVKAFQSHLRERIILEKKTRNDSALTKSHIRNLVFAPERYLD